MSAMSGTTMAQATPTHDSHAADSETGGSSSSKRLKSRHRASIACATCRERRIRCEVPPGERKCKQCQRSGAECIIKNDDERRRPISRAYMSTLTDRVALLETMLKEHGTEPPPVTYPPKTTRGSLYADGDESPARPAVPRFSAAPTSTKNEYSSTEGPSPENESVDGFDLDSTRLNYQRHGNDQDGGSPIDDRRGGLVGRLLSTRGHLSFDQLSGRLRYYGGTANLHIYSELGMVEASCAQPPEQARRAEKCIRTLAIETHDYLMDLFWQHYNVVLHVVHQDAFNEDREHGKTQFYSGFLHICMLAASLMGYRYADKSRPDVQRISLPHRESTLHREAKYMLDLELECPGGIPSVAALLLIGDLEVGVGRDNPGWMYAGMAMRLCYDIGLHLDSRRAGLSQREIDIRRMTLWACVIFDRYWSLFLGRPLTMKSVDLEIYSLADQFERLGTCMPAGPESSTNTRVYEALIDLMEIGGKIVEDAHFQRNTPEVATPDQSAYFRMAAIDRDLHSWAARLPPDLRYTEENRINATFSFYLLHQQYHAVLILLHRPFARYDDEPADIGALDKHFSKASRIICTKSAISIAKIFWQHRAQNFDGKVIFSTAMQHAGVAATALIAALAYMPDVADRNNNMQYLDVLHAALQDMSAASQPAERMAAVLRAVMLELRGGPISPKESDSSGRYSSTTPENDHVVAKRRNTSSLSRKSSSSTMQPPPVMHPPPTSAPRLHHQQQQMSSDTGRDNSSFDMQQQQQQQTQPQLSPSDYVMVTPNNNLPSWPSMPQHHETYHHILAPSDMSTMQSSGETGTHLDWTNNNFDPQAFAPNPSMVGLISGGMNTLPDQQPSEFLYLPTEEDWNRWNNNGLQNAGGAASSHSVAGGSDGMSTGGMNALPPPPRNLYTSHDGFGG